MPETNQSVSTQILLELFRFCQSRKDIIFAFPSHRIQRNGSGDQERAGRQAGRQAGKVAVLVVVLCWVRRQRRKAMNKTQCCTFLLGHSFVRRRRQGFVSSWLDLMMVILCYSLWFLGKETASQLLQLKRQRKQPGIQRVQKMAKFDKDEEILVGSFFDSFSVLLT